MGKPSENLLRTIARLRRKNAHRWPPWVRREVLAHAAEGRAANRGWREIADDLGMTGQTLRRWALGDRRPGRATALAPVEVVHARAPFANSGLQLLTLTSPTGYRVDGLDATTTAALLRALA